MQRRSLFVVVLFLGVGVGPASSSAANGIARAARKEGFPWCDLARVSSPWCFDRVLPGASQNRAPLVRRVTERREREKATSQKKAQEARQGRAGEGDKGAPESEAVECGIGWIPRQPGWPMIDVERREEKKNARRQVMGFPICHLPSLPEEELSAAHV